MNRSARAATLVLVLATAVLAEDRRRVKLTEDDYASYWKLRLAQRVAAKRMELATLGSQREKIEKARQKAFADASWTEARFKDADSAVRAIVRLLEQTKKGGEDEEDAKLTLVEYDKTSVATVTAHLAELTDTAAEIAKADALAREQAAADSPAEPRRDPAGPRDGKPAVEKAKDAGGLDPRWLEGTWEQDVEETVERIAKNVPEGEARESVRTRMTSAFKMQALPKVALGPGGSYEARVEAKTGKSSIKGTWRLEGTRLKVEHDPALNRPATEWELTREGEKLIMASGKKGGIVYRRVEEK